MDSKKSWLSKTVWFNAIVALIGIIASFGILGGVKEWVEANVELIMAAIGLVGIALRAMTGGKIRLK